MSRGSDVAESLADRIAMHIAKHLPQRICYWVLIREGVRHIRDNEIVPEVPFTEVLSRSGAEMRGSE